MTTALIAVLIVLLLAHTLPDLLWLRNFAWFKRWVGWLDQGSGYGGLWSSARGLLLSLVLPVLLCALLQYVLHDVAFGLAGFVFAVLVLYYSWGPRELDRDIEAVLKAPDSERRLQTAQLLRVDGQSPALPLEAPALVAATFQSALKRMFGVLFWFALLGPLGALLYRLTQQLAAGPAYVQRLPPEQALAAQRLALILDWAPAHLMALALALVSNFDAVLHTWRSYHAAHGQGYFTLDLGFLSAIAHASVDADVAGGDGYTVDVHDPMAELADAGHLVRRVLVVWLVVLAIAVLAGWAG